PSTTHCASFLFIVQWVVLTVSDFIPITLTLPSQNVPLLLCDGTVLIVNPYSSHKEQAILWLSFYMNRLPAGEAVALNKEAMPIESQLYQDMKAYYSNEIEKLEIRKQVAEEMVKNDLAAQIQVKQDQLHGRYGCQKHILEE
ncbi:MAG: hypothetical protein RSA55_08295, partial [Clostridia bacterium]